MLALLLTLYNVDRVASKQVKMSSNCRLHFFTGFNCPNNLYFSCQVIAFCFLAMVWLTDTTPFIGKDHHDLNKPYRILLVKLNYFLAEFMITGLDCTSLVEALH